MRWLRYSWDLFFGVFLIGGAPCCVIALMLILGDLLQKVFHVTIPDAIFNTVLSLAFFVAAVTFAFAIRFRLRRRALPAGFLVLEIVLSAAGAFCLFIVLGVLTYASIG